jgi:Flp pilus assembly protein TadD
VDDNVVKIRLSVLLVVLFASNASACIWDSDSMLLEKIRSHDLASAILYNDPVAPDTKKLQKRIKELEANRRETDPDWWNNLAGAYIRLGQPQTAIRLLTPVVAKFPNDYGIHANLGTALHLLGRYNEAEKEIARDLEINPDAHFGLEKYHLALLQYLVRDAKYQSRHVYVDELTATFLTPPVVRFFYRPEFEKVFKDGAMDYTNLADAEADTNFTDTNEDARMREYRLEEHLGVVAALDPPPAYRSHWNLAVETNLEQGVIYMAQMNPREPACYSMLGIAALRKRDYHLAKAAFERAVAFRSPQTELLNWRINELKNYIAKTPALSIQAWAGMAIALVVLYYFYAKIRDRKKRKALA